MPGLFLPSYSPNLPPIEESFSKIKVLLCRGEACTREAPVETICQALLAVREQDAHCRFLHCRYLLAEKLSYQALLSAFRCEMVVVQRCPKPELPYHSNRDSQYTSYTYRHRLQ